VRYSELAGNVRDAIVAVGRIAIKDTQIKDVASV
jgi:hypothetical protein